jgi:hypothetical protein
LHEKTIFHFSSGKTRFFVKQPQEAHSGLKYVGVVTPLPLDPSSWIRIASVPAGARKSIRFAIVH